MPAWIVFIVPRFQSTSPVRGTTIADLPRREIDLFQSTSPVRGTTWTCGIQILALFKFQSTSPVRGTTFCFRSWERSQAYFNPRPP